MSEMIFIKGQIPSLKNSKIMGKYPSKTVQKWLRLYGIQSYSASRKEVKKFKRIKGEYDFYEICKPLLNELRVFPIKLGFHFIRSTTHNWDFNNATQIITDLLTAHNIIPDDNVNYILPFPMKVGGKYWSFNKERPGVIIQTLDDTFEY